MVHTTNGGLSAVDFRTYPDAIKFAKIRVRLSEVTGIEVLRDGQLVWISGSGVIPA